MRKFYSLLLMMSMLILGGVNAWALQIDETYDFRTWGTSNMTKNSYAEISHSSSSVFQVNEVNMYTLVSVSANGKTWTLAQPRIAISDNVTYRWGRGNNDFPRLGNENASGDRYISVAGLKAGDKVKFTNIAGCTFASANAKDGETSVAIGDAVGDAVTYTMSEDGHLDLKIASSTWGSLQKIDVTRFVDDAFCANPKLETTGANGTSRIVSISCETPESSIYYSETEKAVNATGWTAYSGPVTTSATKIWAYAKTTNATSEVVSIETGAGTAIQLAQPVINLTLVNNGTVFNPVYSFSSNQSEVLGSPVVKYTYSVNGGAPIEGESYSPTEIGELVVTVSADGYADNSASIDVNYLDYVNIYSYDFSTTFSSTEGLTQGNGTQNINSTGCQMYQIPANTFEGIEVGDKFQYAWAITANKPFCIQARTGVGTITVNDFPTGAIAVYQAGATVVSTTATTSFGQYTPVYNMNVYAPISETKATIEIGAAGYATYVTPYALDFTDNDIEAYAISELTSGSAKLTKLAQVPAGQAIVVKGATGTVPAIASAEAITNLLTYSESPVTADGTQYILAKVNIEGVDKIGFAKAAASTTIAAGKGFFVASSGIKSFSIEIEEEDVPLAIQSVSTTSSNAAYNLAGQRVAPTQKGIVIINGKKIFNK